MHAPHTLSHCNVFIYFWFLCLVFCSFWAQVKQNNSWYIWQIADFVPGNILILTGNKLPVNANLQIQRHLQIIGGWIRLVVFTYSEIWSLKFFRKNDFYNVWLLVLISHVRLFPTLHLWFPQLSPAVNAQMKQTCRFFTDIPHDVQ